MQIFKTAVLALISYATTTQAVNVSVEKKEPDTPLVSDYKKTMLKDMGCGDCSALNLNHACDHLCIMNDLAWKMVCNDHHDSECQ